MIGAAAVSGGAIAGTTGTTADSYGQAEADLAQMQTQLTAGDTSNTAGSYSDAITSYVAAGLTGATVVGPDIDLAGYPNVTQPWTQAAWQLNTTLAAMASNTSPAATDATQAQTLAYNMYSYYQAAIAAGQQAALLGKPANAPSTLDPKQYGAALLVAGVLIVGSGSGLLYAAWREGKLGGKKGRR